MIRINIEANIILIGIISNPEIHCFRIPKYTDAVVSQ